MITTGREYIDRLRARGMSESSATDICYKYAAQDDEEGLSELVRANELLYDDRLSLLPVILGLLVGNILANLIDALFF